MSDLPNEDERRSEIIDVPGYGLVRVQVQGTLSAKDRRRIAFLLAEIYSIHVPERKVHA